MNISLLAGSVLSLLVLRPSAEGQEVTRFDTVRINQVGSFAVGYSVLETGTGYRVFGLQKGLADQSQDIYVTDFEVGGGLDSETTIQTYRQDNFGQSSPIVQVGPSYYAGVVIFGVGDYYHDSLFLYKFDNSGDTLWTRFIDVDTTYTMRGLGSTTHGDLLITGLHELPEEAYVYRLDSMGTIKSYHGYANFDGEDVVEGSDGSWYVCGRGNQLSTLFKGLLVRTDSAGTELWRRTVNLASFLSMVPTSDSGVVVLGTRTFDLDSGSYAMAVKYNHSGIQQWSTEFLQSDQFNRPSVFYAGFENEAGELFTCGLTRRSDILSKGTLVKMAATGEIIWSRLYTHTDFVSISLEQIFYDVKPTSDGGLVLTGETNTENYPYAQLWLVKLDSMGCLVPGCGSVGVEEYTDLFNGKLAISPNPASERTHVSLTLPEGFATTGALQLYLLDAQGRVVLQQPAQENFNMITGTFNLTGIASGTYYIHLADSKRWLAGGKLIVE